MSRTTTTAAVLVFAATATSALADKYGFYANDDDQQWGLTHMPDFDQKRTPIFNLPGLLNDGKMFCVPTSTMNAFAYIARHGYPEIDPGIGAWDNGSQANYIEITNHLADLGALMGTGGNDGLGGTSAQGWYDGTRDWLPSNKFDVYQRLALSNHDTTTREIARIGRAGGLTMACYGRWEHNGLTLTDRTGGHCITATRVSADGPVLSEFRYRNPSTSDSEFHQDSYKYSTIDCTDLTYSFDGDNYKFSRMEFDISDPDDNRVRLLDFLGVIFAKEGLTNWPAGAVTKIAPNPVEPSDPLTKTFVAPAPVICCEISPGRTEWVLLTEPPVRGGPSGLFAMDPEDGSTRSIASPANPRGMVFCRRSYLNIVDGQDLIQYDLRLPSPEVGRTTLPSTAVAKSIAYDDEADEIVILTDTELVRYGFDLSGPNIEPLPPIAQTREHILLARQVGVPAVIVGDDAGLFWFTRNATGALVEGARHTFPAGTDLTSISLGNDGEIYCSVPPELLVLKVQENTSTGTAEIEFVEVAGGGEFGDTTVGSYFHGTRNRTNYDARVHGTPGWNTNIHTDELVSAPETADCPSDFNADGVSDVLDLLDFLVEWFAGDTAADYNNDTVTDVLDLLDFLTDWFAGCDAV